MWQPRIHHQLSVDGRRQIEPFEPATPAGSALWRMERLDHRSDITVLENHAFALLRSPEGDIHHSLSQVVGPNDLVRKQRPKHGVDRAEQAVAEIRFFPRLHGVDVRGPEDVYAWEPRRE